MGSKRRHLCLPCGWAYRAKTLQRKTTIIRQGDTELHHPSGEDLRSLLKGPLPPTMAILLPVSGKKAVAPLGAWGRIATDHGQVEWTRSLGMALGRVLRLKRLGVSEAALAGSDLPSHLCDSLPPSEWVAAQDDWRRLAPLRQNKAIFPALLKMTRETI